MDIVSTDVFPFEVTIRPKNIISSLGFFQEDILFGHQITLYGVVTSKDGQTYAAYPTEDSNVSSNYLIQNSQPYLFHLPFLCQTCNDSWCLTE